MQRSISRRDFGKGLAGGAALLALQPAWNRLATAQSLRNDLKDLGGDWSFDDAALQAAADDFGHVVHQKPAAMLRPGDAQDIAKLLQFANRRGVKVAMRGQGHSFFGQTQVADGVVVDSSSLNAIRIAQSGTGGTAEIGPGSKWHPVLMAANAQKLTVPVITDTFLSVGGTISTGGFGVTTYNLGLQVDHVQELEVVTGDGQILTCSDAHNSDLFNAMLGGLGQCGIITKVVMRLMTAPTNVLFIKMDYDDFQSASADLALLAKDGRFHHLDGRGAGRPTGRVGYYIEGGAFYDAPNDPDEAKLTAGLKFAKKTVTVMSYEQYFRREEVCTACTTPLQKPFVYLCIPASRYVEYTSGILSSPTESAFLVPRMSAWRRAAIKRPLTRMPDEEIIYRFQLSRTLPAGTDTASTIALNRTLYERARDMGGYRMTSSAVAMSQDDWKRHYGPAWHTVQAAKTKFDPNNVLTPGHGMFPG
ncbi:MAG: FAD-binding protein [Xanthobacteraceae bacterium]